MAIKDYNKFEEFLLQKAKVFIFFNYIFIRMFLNLNSNCHLLQIITEIELFYMSPFQRRKKEWFPDWV